MIETKELPSEYVSLRQIWLKGIDDCRRAISQVAAIETSSERRDWQLAGPRTVSHTVDALYLSLVDYGEALIKTDVEKWMDEYYYPKSDKIWAKKKKKQESSDVRSSSYVDDEEEKEMDIFNKWWTQFKLSKKQYNEIIQVLNKYGMLFQEQPGGYSNVEMRSVQ